MTYKFEIVNRSLTITNVDTGVLVVDRPKKHIYYVNELLSNNRIVLTDNQLIKESFVLFDKDIDKCIDSTDTPFTINSFREFARNNLGTDKTA